MHLNDNGQAVAGGAAFCFAALFFLVYSVQQFRQKGRVLDPVILALEKEKREKTLETGRDYRESAHLFLFFTVICLLVGLALMFDSGWLAMAASVQAVVGALAILLKRIEQV